MATIKSYTDLEQSKKLAEMLPLESADMEYLAIKENGQLVGSVPFAKDDSEVEDSAYSHTYDRIACWSLTALLSVLPKDKSIDCAISFGYYNGKGEYIEKWICSFEKEGETTDDFIIETTDGDNPIDACYEMILKLHEQNLL